MTGYIIYFRCLENEVLKSKRLLVKTNPAPKWTTKVSVNAY